MADQNDKGYAPLPPPQDSTPAPADSGAVQSAATVQSPATVQSLAQTEVVTGSRDLLIVGGVLLVFVIAFFFAKNAYANMLVGSRVPPRKANAAGWWLYILLLSLVTGCSLAAVNHVAFLKLIYVLPLAAVAVVSLILTVVSSRR